MDLFPFFLLLSYYYYLLYGIYEHTLIQIHTFNKFNQAICAVSYLERVMYDFEMHFSAFWLPFNPLTQMSSGMNKNRISVFCTVQGKYVDLSHTRLKHRLKQTGMFDFVQKKVG